MRPIAQYALYFVAGFLQLWLLLFVWGVSAGPAGAMPYVLLLTFLVLGVIGSDVSLFLEKPGALVAVLSGVVGLWWPLVVLLWETPRFVDVAILGALPLVVTIDGCWRLFVLHRTSWLRVKQGPSLFIRSVLATLPLLVVSVVAIPFIRAVEERFVVTAGYMGQVAIVFPLTRPAKDHGMSRGVITYEIPADGVLLAAGEPSRGWRRSKYFYRNSDGSLRSIETIWTSTIHDTPENRADPTVGIYFPTDGITTSGECSFAYETFTVGTKAFILQGRSRYEYELHQRMQELACAHSKANKWAIRLTSGWSGRALPPC